MAKVVMHKANDGALFEKAKECDAHNVKLRLKPAVKEFAEGLGADSHGVTRTEHSHAVFIQDMPDFIAENADKLRAILNESLIVRKPRKTAKKAPVVTA